MVQFDVGWGGGGLRVRKFKREQQCVSDGIFGGFGRGRSPLYECTFHRGRKKGNVWT